MNTPTIHPDSDSHKGAVEDDSPHRPGNKPANQNSLAGQLGHRDSTSDLKDADSDFPEPGSSPEHSGEHK